MTYGRHVARDFFLLTCLFFFVFSSPLGQCFGQVVSNSDGKLSDDTQQLRLLVEEALRYQDLLGIASYSKDFHKITPSHKIADEDESAFSISGSHVLGSAVLVASLLYLSSDWFSAELDSKFAQLVFLAKNIMNDDPKNQTGKLTQNASSSFPEFFVGPASTLLAFCNGRLAATVFCGYHLYSLYTRVQAVYKMVAWLKKYINYVVQFLNIVHKIFSFVGFDKGLRNEHCMQQMHSACFALLKRLQQLLRHVPYDNVVKMYGWCLSGNARKIYALVLDIQQELVMICNELAFLDAKLCVN